MMQDGTRREEVLERMAEFGMYRFPPCRHTYSVARRGLTLFLRHDPSGSVATLPPSPDGVWTLVDGSHEGAHDKAFVPLAGVVISGPWKVANPVIAHATKERRVRIRLTPMGFELRGDPPTHAQS